MRKTWNDPDVKKLREELDNELIANGHTKEFERRWDELQWLMFGRIPFRFLGMRGYIQGFSLKLI